VTPNEMALTPPTCPLCRRRASERFHWELDTVIAPGWDKPCLSPFHDAGDWGPALLEEIKTLADGLRSRCAADGSAYECGLQNQAQSVARLLLDIIAAVEGKEDGDGR
jgi:hypothetical protein